MATEVIPTVQISSSYVVTPMPLEAGRLFNAAAVRELVPPPPPKPPRQPRRTAAERRQIHAARNARYRTANKIIIDKAAKIRRDKLRDENRCINGPADSASPKQHGKVVRGGKCQPCLDVHAKKKKTFREQLAA